MGRPSSVQYELYEIITDQFVFRGTEAECCDFVGTTHGRINDAYKYRKNSTYKRWRIVKVGGNSDYYSVSPSDYEAIERWNEFTRPLRKKYGIPVYRPGKDGAR